MLKASGISKSYPGPEGDVPVLADVSLELGAGEAAAIMGPSGTGKSTLLYILGALERPTSGSVALDGVNPFALPASELAAFRNKEIGFVFQDHCLLPQCSVIENVLVPTLVGAVDADADARARALIDQVGLSHRLGHRPSELSGGEKQRVAIARALIRRPRVLLCDEPTGNLDRRSADSAAALLLELQRRQNTVLVVVTHSQEIASRFGTRFELGDRTLERVA